MIRRAAVLAALLAVGGCGRTPAGFTVLARVPSAVNALAAVGDTVWAGTAADGLVAVPVSGGTPRVFGAGAGLTEGRLQVRWVGASRGGLLLATAGGVVHFDPGKGSVVRTWTAKDGLAGDNVRWAGEVRGRTWAGTTGGASRLEADGRRWRSFTQAQGLPQNHVYRMADDGKAVWASSIMGGLVRFDEQAGRFVVAPQERGLGSRYLYAMEGHPGRLWLGSAAGVNCYDTAERHWVEAVTADGFTGYSVRAVVVDGDDCWFGTAYGLFHRNLATGVQQQWTAGLPDGDVTALAKVGGTTLVIGTKTAVSACRLKRAR